MSKLKTKNNNSMGLSALGWLISLLFIGPLYIIVINSFKTHQQIFTDQLGLPLEWITSTYSEAWERMNYLNSLKNSIIVVGFSVVFIVMLASMAAWAIERRKTAGSNFLYFLFLSTILIPFQSLMLPLVQYFTNWKIPAINFKMVGSLYGLIFFNIGFGLALSLILYVAAIKNVPLEIEESAFIDGATKAQIFWRIVFPNLGPTTATVAILNIISYWNDYLLPSLVLTQDPNLRTIPLSTFYFFGQFNIQWNLALAGLVLTIVPVLIFYIFAQRWIVGGLMAGAVKG